MLFWVSLLGCLRGPVDSFTTQRVVPKALQIGDVDRACRLGGAFGHALNGVPARSPHRAMVIADTTAGICDGAAAREVELQTLVTTRALSGANKVAQIRDGREQERRLKARAAGRFGSAWAHTVDAWPWIGEDCGAVHKRDRVTYLVGMMAGTLAMLDDKASGGSMGVPLDTLAKVGRAAVCVDDADGWGTPRTFEAAAWTVVPGSAPEGLDPWKALEERARAGASSGVRLGWALTAVLASNAGKDALVKTAIRESAASFASVASAPDYRLLDAFAYDLLQHEADLLSIAEHGHRAVGLTVAHPADTPPISTGPDPFGSDPFAEPTGSTLPSDQEP